MRDKSEVRMMRQLAQEYLVRLGHYISSGGSDTASYSWLTQRAPAMQRQLGATGIMTAYRPPAANFQYTNYPILLNMLPELRKAFADSYVLERLASEYGATLQEVMLRHLGDIDQYDTKLAKKLRNPFIWLREGVRTTLAFPLYLLQWFGLTSESVTSTVTGNIIFRFLSSLAVVIGFIGSIVTIVLGWEQFTSMVNQFLPSSVTTKHHVHGPQDPSTTRSPSQQPLGPNNPTAPRVSRPAQAQQANHP